MTNKTTKRRKIKSFRWLNLFAVFIVFFFCFRIGGQIKQYIELQRQVDYYKEQLEMVQADYAAQLARKDLLNNTAYLERMARERLGMVKEGEEVVSIVDIELPEDDTVQVDE